MHTEAKREFALKHLDIILGFFPRVENRLSLVLGVDLGMLALLGTNAPPLHDLGGGLGAYAILPALLLVLSLVEVYRGLFPNLKGGEDSLMYFRTIAGRTEVRFTEEYRKKTPDELTDDVLGQIWRNSEILRLKFDHLKTAFLFMGVAVVPWVISLAVFLSKAPSATHLLSH